MPVAIQRFFLLILPFIARVFPKNWRKEGWKYPQLWYYMPKRWVRAKTERYPNGQFVLYRAKFRLKIEKVCEFLTGHEISKTEKGSDGSSFIDCQCRWCDKSIRVHYRENILEGAFGELVKMLRERKLRE